MNEPMDLEARLAKVREVFEKLPFNRLLGLNVRYLKSDGAGFDFSMKDELIGNFVHGILHGGVISTVLDTTGGMTSAASAMTRIKGVSPDELGERIARFGTIDLRVDYLRPGKGTGFFSSGTVMRTGRKVAVTRMELRNQEDLLIAVGTGTYIVG